MDDSASVVRERTRDAMAAARARGVRLGRPVTLPDEVRDRIVAMRNDDAMTYRAIATTLDADGVPTARGGRWYPSTVAGVCRSAKLDQQALVKRATPGF